MVTLNFMWRYALTALGGGALLCLAVGAVCLLVAAYRVLKGCFGMPLRLILLGRWRAGGLEFERWSGENWWWR